VVSNRRVPVRIRQALKVESGLNDGVTLPAVVILLSCLGAAESGEGAAYWTVFTAKQVLLGPLAGIAVGYVGGMLVKWGQKSGWMSHTFQDLALIGLALGGFSGADGGRQRLHRRLHRRSDPGQHGAQGLRGSVGIRRGRRQPDDAPGLHDLRRGAGAAGPGVRHAEEMA
jgi:hypothetical protein